MAFFEYVRKPSRVYNLQVEGVENFFANGILTHNCLIIDDFLKDYQEAQSETIRENILTSLVDRLYASIS